MTVAPLSLASTPGASGGNGRYYPLVSRNFSPNEKEGANASGGASVGFKGSKDFYQMRMNVQMPLEVTPWVSKAVSIPDPRITDLRSTV